MTSAPFTPRVPRVCAAAALALLAGCSSIKNTVGDTWLGEEMFEDEYIPPCPKVRILAGADTLTLFSDGPGRDLTDVRFEVNLRGHRTACGHDIDDETLAGELHVKTQAAMTADRGPADKSRRLEVPYFVVLRDAASGEPLQKRNFTVTFEFEGNRRRVGRLDDEVDLTIPLYPGRTGRDFTILLGLQLTKAQLQFNRSKKGGR
ncbi:MAG: hypothetical protein ACYYKD_12665 [Rhodospirillales bacterium]